jgi:cytochrome c oxidase cbb3-type subunit IV
MSFTELLADVRSIVTLICMLTFIGIVVWAYSARRKSDFDEAAMLPFADEEKMNMKEQEQHHG